MKSPIQSVSAAAMIPRSPENGEPPLWQRELASSFTDPKQLLDYLQLGEYFDTGMHRAADLFRFKVPQSFARRMRPGDPFDPLLRQVLPLDRELESVKGYSTDPVGDSAARQGHALLQKYRGRALVVATGACAVHCRYCFRRHFNYSNHQVRNDTSIDFLDMIKQDTSIEEVILSGGDPLSLTDERLAGLIQKIRSIVHVKRLRIHTRLPIVLPSRVTRELSELLGSAERVVMVLHVNHPREIDRTVINSLKMLTNNGLSLLNQSVLLHGINDDPDTLVELSEACFDAGILPYYLHLLDPVTGAAHFEVPEADAQGLMEQVRARLPGYLVPRLVKEIPGEPSKTPIG